MTHIVHVLSEASLGDAGKYLINYLSCFDRALYKVTVLLPAGTKLFETMRAFSDVTVIESPYITSKQHNKPCISFLKDFFQLLFMLSNAVH